VAKENTGKQINNIQKKIFIDYRLNIFITDSPAILMVKNENDITPGSTADRD
jgi:hypothetical protein